VLAVLGVWSYLNTPIETFPDVTNTQIIIIAQWPGRSAEEVEKMITVPDGDRAELGTKKGKPAYHIIIRPILRAYHF
jgi:Cu/Ag efflux pump CusA